MSYTITLAQWETLLSSGYQGFDPAFDVTTNLDESITDLNSTFEVTTTDIDAINYFNNL